MSLSFSQPDRALIRRDVLTLLGESIAVEDEFLDDEDLSFRGLTSMAVMALIYSVEDHFGIEVPEHQMRLKNFLTVNGIIEIVIDNSRATDAQL